MRPILADSPSIGQTDMGILVSRPRGMVAWVLTCGVLSIRPGHGVALSGTYKSGGVSLVEFSRHTSPQAVAAREHIFADILGADCVGQIADVVGAEVISQRIKLSRFQALPETAPAVLGALRGREPAELAVRVEVHQPAGVAVAHPDRWNPREDVVVVNPAVVFRKSAMIDVASGADARAAKSEQPGRIRFDFSTACSGLRRSPP
jgi:hypothetical protein